MTVATDIQGDWQHMGDVIEDVTHTDATDDSTEAVKANRDELSFREISANGPAGIEPTDIVWVVWAETLDGATLEQGDTLTDSTGAVWTVQSFTAKSIGATVVKYRCICRKQV